MNNQDVDYLRVKMVNTWKQYQASKRLIASWNNHSIRGLSILDKIRDRSMVLLHEAWMISDRIHSIQCSNDERLSNGSQSFT